VLLGDCIRIAVALERPGVNDLASLLLDRRQNQCRDQFGVTPVSSSNSRLRGFEQILARLDLALGGSSMRPSSLFWKNGPPG